MPLKPKPNWCGTIFGTAKVSWTAWINEDDDCFFEADAREVGKVKFEEECLFEVDDVVVTHAHSDNEPPEEDHRDGRS